MGIENDEDVKTLISKLPEDAKQSLPMILAPMQKYVKESERLFEKYGIVSPDLGDRRMTLKDKGRRVNFLMDGQRELDEIMDTLKNCNDGLLTIAPPAPGYYVSLAGNDQLLERSDEAEFPGLDSLRRPQVPQSTSQSLSPSINDGRSETGPLNVRTPALKDPVHKTTKKVFHPVIELLHSTCLRILRSMAVQYPTHRETFQSTGDRLEIWGTGLFQGQVSIDQALNKKSKALGLLRNNIAGTLADIAVILRHVLSILGESDNSASTLQIRELFSFPEISLLPLGSLSFGEDPDEGLEETIRVNLWSREIAELTQCLFCTLSTAEMVLKETIAHQRENAAVDERDLILIKSDSEISLPSLPPAPAKDLLRIDLQLIAAMQNSLKDSQFAKYMEHRNLKFDATQLYKDLEEESRQMKYWASQLGSSNENQSMTSETQAAMVLNLTRIARTFAAGFKSTKTSRDLDTETQTILDQCVKKFPEFEAALTSPLPESKSFEPLDVLRSSNVEFKQLARSKAPELKYTNDFALSEKGKLAAAERASYSGLMGS